MVMNSPAKFFAALFVACIFTISNSNLVAQSMHGLEELELATDYSAPYAGQALWISFSYVGWPEHVSHASAVRLNQCWGLTAGHVVLNDTGYLKENFRVGNGTNWVDDRGIERAVVETILHPTWNGSWNGSRVDLALIRWNQPLAGQNLEIGSLSIGEKFDYAGYGRPATPALGGLPYDGQRRGFEIVAQQWGNGAGTISTKYVRSPFLQGQFPMGGIGTGGGSGSGGFNSTGELVSLLVYQVGSPYYMGLSYGLRLDLYEDWITSYTNDLSCLPPPPRPPHGGILETAVRRDVLAF